MFINTSKPETSEGLTFTQLVLVCAAVALAVSLPFTLRLAKANASEPLALELSETLELPGLGFSIDYPAGWHVTPAEEGDAVRITQLSSFAERGLFVSLDVLPLEDLPLASNAPGLDVTVYMLKALGLTDVAIEEASFTDTQLFGAIARRVRGSNEGGFMVDALQGVTGQNAFFLVATAPSQKQMDVFAPSWKRMIASIRQKEP